MGGERRLLKERIIPKTAGTFPRRELKKHGLQLSAA